MTPSALALSEYELRHLPAHLEAAGRLDDLHRLLRMEAPTGQNLWYTAKADAGQDDGYADDLDRAWRLARTAADRPLEARYALMTASVASLAGSVPPSLVIRLVAVGAWTAERAVSVARRTPDLERRAMTLADVADGVPLPAQERERLFREAMQAATQIGDVYQQSRTVAALALKLPPSLLPLASSMASATPEALEAEYSTGSPAAGEGGADRSVDPADVEGVLDDAERSESEAERVRLLTAAIPQLTTATVDRALRVVADTPGEFQRTVALARLLPRLMELGRTEEARAALEHLASTRSLDEGLARLVIGDPATRKPIDDPFWAAEAAARAVPSGSSDEVDRLQQALQAARRVGDEEPSDALLADAVALLAERGAGDHAAEAAAGILGPRRQAEAIAALAAAASVSGERLLALAEELSDPHWRAVALLGALPPLDGARREAVVDDIAAATAVAARPAQAAEVLVRLGAGSVGENRDVAWRRALELVATDGDAARATVLLAGIACAPAAWEPVALREVDALSDEAVRGRVLLALAVALAGTGDGAEAVAIAQRVADPYWRNVALGGAASALAARGLRTDALAALAALDTVFLTPGLAADLAARLGPGAVDTLLERLAWHPDAGRRAHCLASLLDAVPAGRQRDDVAAAARSAVAATGDERERAVAVTMLAAAVVLHAEEAARVVSAIEDPRPRAVAQLGVAMAGTAQPEAADIARQELRALPVDTAAPVALRLAAAVPACRGALLPSMVRMLGAIADPEIRLRVVRAVAGGVADADDATARRCWTDALLWSAPAGRAVLARTLGALLPVAERLEGTTLVDEVVACVAEVRRWWP